jgi:hypothetical protein
MYIGLRVKYRYCCQILMKLEFSGQISKIYSNIKFQENPSSGSRVVPCGRTDIKKLIVAFRNITNAPNNSKFHCHYLQNLKPNKIHMK